MCITIISYVYKLQVQIQIPSSSHNYNYLFFTKPKVNSPCKRDVWQSVPVNKNTQTVVKQLVLLINIEPKCSESSHLPSKRNDLQNNKQQRQHENLPLWKRWDVKDNLKMLKTSRHNSDRISFLTDKAVFIKSKNHLSTCTKISSESLSYFIQIITGTHPKCCTQRQHQAHLWTKWKSTWEL